MNTPHHAAVITNFGANRRFQPEAVYAPRSEAELLEILGKHRGQRIHAVGRLHSWSEAPVGEEIVVDLRHLRQVRVQGDTADPWAEVGAGCQIQQLLDELHRQGGYTLHSLGLITEQSVAGAAATATHGSGRSSMSHYIKSVRLAGYDLATGQPIVRVIDRGPELQAARCGLGSLGIVTSLQLPIRSQYYVEEHFRRYQTLDQVLLREGDFDLQQFFLIPWRWDYFAQHRREVAGPRGRLAWLYRLYWSVGMDVSLHLLILTLTRALPAAATKGCFRQVIPRLVPQNWRVVDRADRQLTMQHELFRHIEIEMFVVRSRLAAALAFITWLLRWLGGDRIDPPAETRERLEQRGCWDRIQRCLGGYVHHYPICVRRVLPDDALISMTSGNTESAYALSFISYARPQRRSEFFEFAAILAETMAELFDARPHWGKYCPLSPAQLRRLYPRWDEFAALCRQSGAYDHCANNWVRSLLE